jgi:hypothetical protein
VIRARAIAFITGAIAVTFVTFAPAIASQGAHAGGLVVGSGSPRAIGRAGANVVGDDGGGALLVNPAALARREGWRAQLGLAFADDEIAWRGDASAPVARNQAPSSAAPLGAIVGAIDGWVIGLGAMTSAISDRGLRTPGAIPPEDFERAFDYRYAGLRGFARLDTITAGIARRVGDQLAVGVALAGSRMAFAENRRMWAGFSGRDRIGAPANDLEIELVGRDRLVPSATLGVLVVPVDEPIELGASLAWSADATIEADVTARGTEGGPSISITGAPAGSLVLRQPWQARFGARYLGDRYVVELAGELAVAPPSAAAPVWRVEGLAVRDPSRVLVDLTRVPSRASMRRRHGAVRTAIDVELVGGFLWATAGYAFTVGSVEATRQSPSFGDLGGHTLALGLEGAHGGFTFTLGWSRTWSVARREDSGLRHDNPFAAGDAALATGTYDGSIDQLGILIDAELDAPE